MNKNDLVKLFNAEREKHKDLSLFYTFGDMSLKYTTNEGQSLKVTFQEDNKETFLYYPTLNTKKKDSICVQTLEENGMVGEFTDDFETMPKVLRDIGTEYQYDRANINLPAERQRNNQKSDPVTSKKKRVERDM